MPAKRPGFQIEKAFARGLKLADLHEQTVRRKEQGRLVGFRTERAAVDDPDSETPAARRKPGRPRKTTPAPDRTLSSPASTPSTIDTLIDDPPEDLARIEAHWATWLLTLFPTYITAPFAPHHVEFWKWAWAIRPHQRSRPFIGIWPRGGGKSFNAAAAVIALGARRIRNYAVYVSESQEQADKHLADDIAPRLESADVAAFYPGMAEAAITKYGQHKGWRRNRIHTRSGFVIDALGLDVASRGMRVEEFRPDILVFDDIDTDTDTERTVERKISTLTRRILPACVPHATIIGIQNLIHVDSIFARLADNRAEFLADRIVSGPIPAIRDLTYETRITDDGRTRHIITGGEPTWAGQSIDICQQEIDKDGISVFKSELQQETPDETGGMYDDVIFRRAHWASERCNDPTLACDGAHVPQLDKIVCWVDPAVTDTDESDSQAVQIDGISRDRTLYRLYSWEQRSSPQRAIQHALTKALEYGAIYVGIETDQGGDTWKSVFREQQDALGPAYTHIQMRAAKAGQGHGNKVHRSSQMLSEYERGLIVHVEGTHHILERALLRFPRKKPFDLTDCAYWGWWDLRRLSRPAKISSGANRRFADPSSPGSSRLPIAATGTSGRRRLASVIPLPSSSSRSSGPPRRF